MTFHILLANVRERAEGIKKTYLYDNERKKIKMQMKEKEKIENTVLLALLQRAEIF